MRERRKQEGPRRRDAITKLKALADDSQLQDEAVRGLVGLWLQNLLPPSDLVPYAKTVVALWRRVFERVKPLQQDVVTVEWLLDDQYAGLSSEG
jgi:hypothetical protein